MTSQPSGARQPGGQAEPEPPERLLRRSARGEAAAQVLPPPQAPPRRQQEQQGSPPPPSQPAAQQQQVQLLSHEQQAEAAFRLCQAEQWSVFDIWIGAVSLTLLAVLPTQLQRQTWSERPATALLELLTLVLPGARAYLAPAFYRPRRSPIVASVRLLNCCLLASNAVPQPPPVGWPTWLTILALTRCISLNLHSWANRLNFKVFLWVHLVAVAEAARVAITHICRMPALAGSGVQLELQSAGRLADTLARLLDPGTPLFPTTMAGASSAGGPTGGGGNGSCTCLHWALFLLASVGCGFPIACHYIAQAASRKAFFCRYCRTRSCCTCIRAKSTDVPMLAASAALLFLGYSSACWHLVASMLHLLPCTRAA